MWNGIVANPTVAPLTQLPRMMAISGGYPIRHDGGVIGAVGVSGGSADLDLKVAADALEAMGFSVEA